MYLLSFQNLSKLLSTKKYRTGDLHQTRSRLKYDLQSQSDKIVVFIDDLDRLLDDEISSLIQAVKAVGDLRMSHMCCSMTRHM